MVLIVRFREPNFSIERDFSSRCPSKSSLLAEASIDCIRSTFRLEVSARSIIKPTDTVGMKTSSTKFRRV